MTDANEDLVRRGYQAFSEGDMETLSSLFAPMPSTSQPAAARCRASTRAWTRSWRTTARSSS
jgi:ketosteroid isomerase-like protein